MDRPPIEAVVEQSARGERLDRFLRALLPGVSSGSLRRLLEQKQVWVEGRPGKKGQRLDGGERVLIAVAASDERPIPQPELELEVLAVSAAVVVVAKPPGMACHPLLPGELDTVANALLARYPECGSASEAPREGGLVHRLDWNTSGVLLAARSRPVYNRLRALFGAGEVHKEYLALVCGELRAACRVDLPLRTQPGDRRRMGIAPEPELGQPAESEIEPLAALSGQTTLVRVRCHTGRRHQVRVHLASLGHPLLGDTLYGGKELEGESGALLHAASVSVGGEVFRAPLPAARRALLRGLGWNESEADDSNGG